MQITHCIIHNLQKMPGETEAKAFPAEKELPQNNYLDVLIDQLNRIYNAKPEKAYGHFVDEATLEPDLKPLALFQQQLSNHMNDAISFEAFTLQSLERLKTTISQVNLATGGYVLFATYKMALTEYLLIAMLNQSDGVAIDEMLNVKEVQHLDLSQMHLACRINLTEWQINQTSLKYISFIKGRSGAKVSDYFLEFIGCQESIRAADETKNLLSSVDTFCQSQSLEQKAQKELKKKVFEYCNDKAKSGESVRLNELSSHLNENDPDAFFTFASDSQGIAPELPPDRKVLRTLIKYSGQAAGVSVSFNADLLGESVIYDEVNDQLIIKTIPPKLKQMLQK